METPKNKNKFFDALKKAFKNFKDYKSRSCRYEYWFWVLFIFLSSILISIISELLSLLHISLMIILLVAFYIFVVIFTLPLCLRRLHDIGKNGWFILIELIPIIGTIILLIFKCRDSVKEPNKWGDSPKDSDPPVEKFELVRNI